MLFIKKEEIHLALSKNRSNARLVANHSTDLITSNYITETILVKDRISVRNARNLSRRQVSSNYIVQFTLKKAHTLAKHAIKRLNMRVVSKYTFEFIQAKNHTNVRYVQRDSPYHSKDIEKPMSDLIRKKIKILTVTLLFL